VTGSCTLSVFRQITNGGGQCASCKLVMPVLSVRSNWFHIASAPVALSLTSAPSDGTTDQILLPAPVVQIQDALGTRVRHADLYVTTSILRQYFDGRAPERLHNQVELTKHGISVLSALTVTTSGNYIIQVIAGGLNPDTSAPFQIFPGSFSNMGITSQPNGGVGGQPLIQQPIIALQDACGNTLTALHHVLISFELLASSGAAAEGSLMSPALATGTLFGIASFNNITVAHVGTYCLRFSTIPDLQRGVTNSTLTSNRFDVIAGLPQSLFLATMAGGCVVREACRQQPIIQVVDAGGNAVRSDSGDSEVLVSMLSHPTQPPVNQSSKASVDAWQAKQWSVVLLSSSVATFTDIRSDTTGAFVLQFTHRGPGSQVQSDAGHLRGIVSPVFLVSTRASIVKVEHQPSGDLKFPQSGVELLEQPIVSVTGSDTNVVDLDTAWYMAVTLFDDKRSDMAQPTLGTTIATAANGRASFTDLRIDVTAKCYRMKFTLGTMRHGIFSPAPALSVKSWPFAVSIGHPRQILIIREPGGVVTGQIMAVQPIVSITDASANVIASDSRSTVTASLINTPPHTYFDPDEGLTGIPDSSEKVEIVDKGIATFGGMILTAASACMQMKFSRLGLRSAESQEFVTFAAEPAQLIISADFQPSGAQPGLALRQQPWLLLLDKYGNMCVSNIVETSLVDSKLEIEPMQIWQGLSPQPNDAVLAGSTAQQLRAGGAKFTDLRIDKAGLYRLNFRSMGLHTLSAELGVHTGVGSRLSCVQVPDGTRAGSSFMFERPPVVVVQDAGANFVAISNVLVHMYVLANYSQDDVLLQSSFGSWLPACRSSFEGQMFTHGKPNQNLSSTAVTRSGIATFTGLSFSSISPQTVLRFCAKRMDMDISFSEATTVAVDSSLFDISGEVQQILLDRHPAQSVGITAGEAFSVQPVARLVDSANLKATWCGSRPRPVDFQGLNKSIISQTSKYKNSSFYFAAYDRDGAAPFCSP
jgi:trimeric autotransporter adhesin